MQMQRTKVIARSAAAEQDPSSNKGVNPEATSTPLPSGHTATSQPALASGQTPRTKPAGDRKKPTVKGISKAMFDLEEMYARVSPLLGNHTAGKRYFADELWRILGVLGRIKMTLSSPDLPSFPAAPRPAQ
jgi:hypothetical protein